MDGDNLEDATLFQAEDDQVSAREMSRDAADYEIPGVTLDRILGSGTFGEVWAGVQERTGQKVAIKLFTHRMGLDWEYFCKEVERLREVSEHPNIVTLLDADLNHDPPYLVMPQLTGGSLADQKARPDTDQVVTWFYQISEALHYIHQKELLHCDLKPANVLLDGEGRARLVDFGQALATGGVQTSLGTVGYMAPEQVQSALGTNPDPPDPRWDVYSLGATAYNLLVGQLPRIPLAARNELSGLTNAQERLEHYGETLSRAPLINIGEVNRSVDPELAAIIEGCLALDPDQRPQTAGEVVEDLGRWRQNLPLMVKQPWTKRYQGTRFFKRNQSTVLLIASFIIVLIGFNWMINPGSLVAKKPEVVADTGGFEGPTDNNFDNDDTDRDFEEEELQETNRRLVRFLQAALAESQRSEEQRQGLPEMDFPLLWQSRLPDRVLSLKHSPGGHWLGVRTSDGRAYLLEADSGRGRDLEGLSCFDFGPGRLALGFVDGRVEIRDGALKSRRKLGRHKGLVTSVQLQGKTALSASLDGTVHTWGRKPKKFSAPVLSALRMGDQLAVATADGRLHWRGKAIKVPGVLFELESGRSLSGLLTSGEGVVFENGAVSSKAAASDQGFEVRGSFLVAKGDESEQSPEISIPLAEQPQRVVVTEGQVYLVNGRVLRCYGRAPTDRGRLDRDLPSDLVMLKAELEAGGRLNKEQELELFSVAEWGSRGAAYHQLRSDHKLRCRYPASW